MYAPGLQIQWPIRIFIKKWLALIKSKSAVAVPDQDSDAIAVL